VTDDELLEQVKAAFVIDLRDDVPPSLHALDRALSDLRSAVPATARPRRRWPIAALVGAVAAGTPGVAFAATGAPLPQPLRQAAYAVGLPVDSPDLAAARSARSHLRHDLERGDRDAATKSAARLRARLGDLNHDERGEIQQDTAGLLHQADELSGQQGAQAGTGNGSSPATPTTGTTGDSGGINGGPSGGASSPSGVSSGSGDTGTTANSPSQTNEPG
jgi:hypothetical protein